MEVRSKRGMRLAIALGAVAIAAMTASAGCGDGGAAGSFEPAEPGTLVVATEGFPVAGFWEGTADQPTGGFEYELARKLADRFGLDDLEIVVVPFSRIIEGDLGGADMALSLVTPTDAREEHLDFSDPYLSAPPAILAPADLDVPDLETARDLTFAVETGTTLQTELEEKIDPEVPILIGADRDAVLGDLESGDADAAIFDLPAAQALADQSDGAWHVAAKLDTDETIAAALPEGSTDNAEAVGSAIRAFDADGTLTELSDEWLGAELTDGAQSVPLLRTSR